jgi:hypothetical protein
VGETAGEEWAPKEPNNWKYHGSKPGAALSLVHAVHEKGIWSKPYLDRIGEAMQRWPAAGAVENMQCQQLQYYLRSPPKGVRVNLKKESPARWKGGMTALVADLVKREGPALRRAVQADSPDEQLPTLDGCRKELESLYTELAGVKKAAAKTKDAHRKLKEGKKTKRQGVKQAAQKRMQAKLVDAKERYKKTLKEAKAVALSKAREVATEEENSKITQLAKERSTAQARARAVEWAAREGESWKEKAKASQKRVRELNTRVEELEAESESDSDSGVETLPLWSLGGSYSRRDERGRFEADDWRLRPIEWGQISRRTPTGAIGANIRDVLSVYAPGARYAEPAERQLRARRIESTIAGECCAHLRVALSLRVISFGIDESHKFGLGLLSTNTQVGCSRVE